MQATESFRGAGDTMDLALVVMPAEASDRDAVHRVVERMGFRVESHRDAGTALEAVEYLTPGLVVHNWDLPDMDGATFHSAVQRRAGGRHVPTLAIMPADRTPDQHVGVRTGIDDYICRPFQEEALRARLNGLVTHDGPEAAPPARAVSPERKEREMIETTAPARPAESTNGPPRAELHEGDPAALRVAYVGLGEWGTRGAEILAREGVAARALDTDAVVERARLDASRRHRIAPPSRAGTGDWAAWARALASDPGLGEGLAEDASAELIVVGGDAGVDAGALLAVLLRRVAAEAPRAGRLAVIRLPGLRSGPDERALALVALNAVLKSPPSGVLLVQPPDGAGGWVFDGDAHAPLTRLVELWRHTSGESDETVLRGLRWAGLRRLLATPGFIGWRETEITREDCATEAGAWHRKLADGAVPWQPSGFQWSEAQAVLTIVRAPEPWLEAGGANHFGRLVQEAWDEAAPCSLERGLYAGDEPARALLVSAGMPYPQGMLALRDSVEADRARLAEKRRAAESLIPLEEEFLAEASALLEPVEVPEAPAGAGRGPTPEVEAGPEPVAASEEAASEEAAPERAVEEAVPEPAVEEVSPEPPPEPPVAAAEPRPETVEEPASAPETGKSPAETRATTVAPAPEVAVPEPGEVPPAYETALGLARRVLGAEDLRAEADLGEVRYALYDVLEILREEPETILPEVFRPSLDEWFTRHHVNVAVLAILTGDLLKGSLSEVIDLGTAALLHDVGMVKTREMWDVPMKLPPKVFERAVRVHPEEGFERLRDVPGMTAPVARIVLEEHERMDGTGYPEGLVGDAIDPGARILAVCDTLEALTHPRPHRGQLPLSEALGRLDILGEYTLDGAIVHLLTEELGEILQRPRRGDGW